MIYLLQFLVLKNILIKIFTRYLEPFQKTQLKYHVVPNTTEIPRGSWQPVWELLLLEASSHLVWFISHTYVSIWL